MSGKPVRHPNAHFTEEQLNFLREHVQGRSYEELAVLFNKQFGTTTYGRTISRACRRRGWSNGRSNRRPYSDEQIEFLRENVKGQSYAELATVFNKRFGTAYSERNVGDVCRYHGFANGLDCRYSKGHTTNLGRKFNHALPDGSETVNVDGYIIIKRNGKWQTKQSAIWEETYGPIPDGHRIVFGDGDRRNFNLENLHSIPQSQAAIRTNMRLKSNSPELAAMGVALAGLYEVIGKCRKRKKKMNP